MVVTATSCERAKCPFRRSGRVGGRCILDNTIDVEWWYKINRPQKSDELFPPNCPLRKGPVKVRLP